MLMLNNKYAITNNFQHVQSFNIIKAGENRAQLLNDKTLVNQFDKIFNKKIV